MRQSAVRLVGVSAPAPTCLEWRPLRWFEKPPLSFAFLISLFTTDPGSDEKAAPLPVIGDAVAHIRHGVRVWAGRIYDEPVSLGGIQPFVGRRNSNPRKSTQPRGLIRGGRKGERRKPRDQNHSAAGERSLPVIGAIVYRPVITSASRCSSWPQ
jgi:hypothetical protein